MDFFESQEKARKKTKWLVCYFVLAVVLIILAIYFAVLFLFGPAFDPVAAKEGRYRILIPELLVAVTGGTLLLIGAGSLFKILLLRRGGPAVAEMIGARPVDPNTRDFKERQYINVVEEMSIASGTPVPAIYILDSESGINAFAAGYSPGDAVVAVTRGCLDQLSRDELQGVIAHEFSHILNGDMRLNIRLIGLLNGILLLAIVGRAFLHGSARGRALSAGRRRGDSAVPALVLGLVLILVGWIGVFFGKLIKAAVSRQREFLADASAVQFTRNPAGIAGALKKLGGIDEGSRIQNYHADELSHLFFANALRASLGRLLSTHPPIEERIRRVDRYFQMKLQEPQAGSPTTATASGLAAGFAAGGTVSPASLQVEPGVLMGSVGSPTGSHVEYAAELLGRIPKVLEAAAHDPLDAEALVYSLLLDRDSETRERQRKILRRDAGGYVYEKMEALLPLVEKLGHEGHLPLIDLSLPALRRLSSPQYKSFVRTIRELIYVDGKVTFFEYALEKVLERRLSVHFEEASPAGTRFQSLEAVREDVRAVVSALAQTGADSPEEASRAFEAAVSRLPRSLSDMTLLESDQVDFGRIDQALGNLEHLAEGAKKAFLEACAWSVAYNHVVDREEAELLRAVADAVDCPMPPVLPDPPRSAV